MKTDKKPLGNRKWLLPRVKGILTRHPRISSCTCSTVVPAPGHYANGIQGSVGRHKGTNKLPGPCFQIACSLPLCAFFCGSSTLMEVGQCIEERKWLLFDGYTEAKALC